MKAQLFTSALCALSLTAVAAFAQPSGGPDAKGNAPLKAPHPVNNGVAKPGHNSFTEGQARQHIEKSGFTGVSALTKGTDGVWRDQAMRAGQQVDVAMDFKGDVTTASPPGMRSTMTRAPGAPPMAATETDGRTAMATKTTTTETTTHHRRHHRSSRCAQAQREGAACSGVDKNDNGVSDREDRMHGSNPN